MKLLLNIIALIALVACAAPKAVETNVVAASAAASTHKMSDYFKESQQLNASKTLKELIQTAQKDSSNPEPLYGIGYLHMQSGINNKNARELELAEIYLKEVLTKFPGNQAVLQALYNVYYDNTLQNRGNDSFDNAKKIFTQLPESGRANINPPSLAKYAATVLQQERDRQSNHQMLRDILLQAIQESPQTDTSYIYLAKLYSDDRYFALALATLKLGEENIQSSVELYKSIADTYVKRSEVNGCNYEHASDIQNSGKYYQLAIPLKPDDQALHFALSQSFLDQNLNELGLNEAKIAVDLQASSESISLNAQNLSVLGYNTQAVTLLQNAIGKGYGPSDTGYHEIYMNKGDWKNAAEGFNAYVKARDKFSVYDLMKNDIIAQQAHVESVVPIKKVLISNAWEQALFNYWGARSSADDLKKIAYTSCEKTEYYFYTGYKDLQAGKTAQANTKFSAALGEKTYRFIERPLARYFLEHNSLNTTN
ncbi:MAG: hypothetical protein EOO53_07285 [Gammaproteobacteria bacterium]|nr:MAG: hypothetical protein EOO53_07285 [Gammaproteobacteria bacterium]